MTKNHEIYVRRSLFVYKSQIAAWKFILQILLRRYFKNLAISPKKHQFLRNGRDGCFLPKSRRFNLLNNSNTSCMLFSRCSFMNDKMSLKKSWTRSSTWGQTKKQKQYQLPGWPSPTDSDVNRKYLLSFASVDILVWWLFSLSVAAAICHAKSVVSDCGHNPSYFYIFYNTLLSNQKFIFT